MKEVNCLECKYRKGGQNKYDVEVCSKHDCLLFHTKVGCEFLGKDYLFPCEECDSKDFSKVVE